MPNWSNKQATKCDFLKLLKQISELNPTSDLNAEYAKQEISLTHKDDTTLEQLLQPEEMEMWSIWAIMGP